MNNEIEYQEVNYIPYKNGHIKHEHIIFKRSQNEFKQKSRTNSLPKTKPKS